MKKLVFTFQVFGVIAMFPLYVIVEFKHTKEALPVNNFYSVIKKKQEDNSIQSRVKKENVVFVTGENKKLLK